MNQLIDLIIFTVFLVLTVIGLIFNFLLRKEVLRTRPLNVTAPKFIFSVFGFNIFVLEASVIIITFYILYILLAVTLSLL